MSNKLTREVKYLQESDRPKKVEPFSFTEWLKSINSNRVHEMNYPQLNNFATQYATYLQEFSAEEVGVEIFEYHKKGEFNKPTAKLSDYDSVEYIGICKEDGDIFKATWHGIVTIYYGKLNSGKY